MVDINYALQTHDVSSWQGIERYAGSKTEVVRKCVSSFFHSVEFAAKQRPESNHIIKIFDDHSTEETLEFLNRCMKRFDKENVSVFIEHLDKKGIMSSIRSCYEWMEFSGKDLVMQVQDDYLFTETAIFEIIDVFMQLRQDVQSDAIVASFHDHRYWKTIYRYKVTPRVIFPGAYQNWMQIYDIPCTFLTSKEQFSKHWDLYDIFFNTDLNNTVGDLENKSLNKMFTERGVLGVQPFTSVALHMQDEYWKDPYIDWRKRWNSVEVI